MQGEKKQLGPNTKQSSLNWAKGLNSVYSSAVVCTVVSHGEESTALFCFIPAREEQG